MCSKVLTLGLIILKVNCQQSGKSRTDPSCAKLPTGLQLLHNYTLMEVRKYFGRVVITYVNVCFNLIIIIR